MAWDEKIFAEAVAVRDNFEAKIQRETDERIASVQRNLHRPMRRLQYLIFPSLRGEFEQATNEVVDRMKRRMADSAKRQARVRIDMKGLSASQLMELGRYLIGTPEESNILLDEAPEMNEEG